MRPFLSATLLSLFVVGCGPHAPTTGPSGAEDFVGTWLGFQVAFQPCGRFYDSDGLWTHWQVAATTDSQLSIKVLGDSFQDVHASVKDGVATLEKYTSDPFEVASGMTETDTLESGTTRIVDGQLSFAFSATIKLSDGSSCAYDAHGKYSKQ